jgi:hypothetical protein
VRKLHVLKSGPPNNALKLTAHRCGSVGAGAPQLNAVLGRPSVTER